MAEKDRRNSKVAKRRGITLIEVTISMAIIMIISSMSLFKYKKSKEVNDIKMVETKIITTVNNFNIIARLNNETMYMKFYKNGIDVLKLNGNNPERQLDTGVNTAQLKKAKLTAIFNCEDQTSDIPCPIGISAVGNNDSFDENLRGNTEPVKVDLENPDKYLKLSGKVSKNFGVFVFDKSNRIKSILIFESTKFLNIRKYIPSGNNSMIEDSDLMKNSFDSTKGKEVIELLITEKDGTSDWIDSFTFVRNDPKFEL